MDDQTGQRQDINQPGHPVGPEMDDTMNPTDASTRGSTPHLDPSEDFGGERASIAATSGEETWGGQANAGSDSRSSELPPADIPDAPGLDPSEDFGGERASIAATSGEEAWAPEGDEAARNQPWYDKQGGARGTAGREMLVQLQQMIDTLATQAAPVMREVAAKAAELAAVAGEKAGPLAHKAAGMTESVGQRVAARSKTMAADLRRPRDASLDVEEDIASSNEWGTDSGESSVPPESEPRSDQGG